MTTFGAPAISVSAEERAQLAVMARSEVLPRRVVTQARALLLAADGVANEQIARSCSVSSDTVRRWRARMEESGLAGIGVIAKGRGRKSSLTAETITEVLRISQHEPPRGGASRWSTRSMAARVGIGKDAVARIWAEYEPRPATGGPGKSQPEDGERLKLALLRGDVPEIHRLVGAEDGRLRHDLPLEEAKALTGRSFASILDSDFSTAYDLAHAGLGTGVEPVLFRSLCALSSGMGGLERDGSDIASVERAVGDIDRLGNEQLMKEVWAAALTAEAAMSVGRLDLAETVARRVWLSSTDTDPPEAIFAGQTLVRALLFQGRLDDASALATHVDQGAQRHGLDALRLVVRGSLAYVDALRGRDDELTLHATTIDQLAPKCPVSYFVSGALVLTAYALATAQRAQEATEVLLRGAGGPLLPNIQLVDRAYGYELLVTATLSLGDIVAARQWGQYAAGLTGLPPAGMATAALGRIRARLAVADGEVMTGVELAEQAAATAAGNAGRLDATRAQLLAGSALLLDTSDNRAARLALSRASEQALVLGARSLALLARRDLRSIGLRLIGEPQAPMTPREREVAELLLAGASNGQIASTLGVSIRTAQSHVTRVLKALDLPSRAAVPRALRANPELDARTRELTPRQYEVAALISLGYTNKGAARALNISSKTIEKHLGDIYRRLDIDSRSALAANWWRQLGPA